MPGHFPQRPIFPASLMMEALGQLAILWMVERYQNEGLNQESIFLSRVRMSSAAVNASSGIL